MKVNFIKKYEYGHIRIYPGDPTAQKLTDLTGRKTVLQDHLKILKDLGYEPIIKIEKRVK